MCRIVSVTVGLALCFSVTALSTAEGQQQGNYFYCHSTETSGGKVYVTGLLSSGASAQTLNDAFANYLQMEHGYADPRRGYRQLSCTTGMPENQKSVTIRQGYINNLAALGNTVVETNWAGPPGTTVPENPPPAPADKARSPK